MRRVLGFSIAGLALLGAVAAHAQPKPAPKPSTASTPAADAAFEDQKAAFMGLAEDDRKAAQGDLVWVGAYNGAADGTFGKRTRDAIVAFQTSLKATADGLLTPALAAALKSAADKARAGVGFTVIDDPKSGLRYGAPMKLLDRKAAIPGGVTLSRADGSIRLTVEERKDADADLAALYARQIAEGPTRKITYKAIKDNAFFVVSGVDGGQKFYLRFDRAPDGAALVRGFTFAYAESRDDLDKVALAVANAFEPFRSPSANAPQAAASPEAKTTPAPKASASAPAGGVALVIGPGKALTTLAPDRCPHPLIAGKPATFDGGADGKPPFVVSGDFAPQGAPPAVAAHPPSEGFVVAYAEANPARLVASDATLGAVGDKAFAIAPLSRSAAGAPIFARDGSLVGMTLPGAAEPPRVNGRVVGAARLYVPASGVANLGARVAEGAPTLTVGEILKAKAESVLSLNCAP